MLFWDVMFWDNTLPMGDGVGLVVDGHYVADWTIRVQLLPQFTAPQDALTIRLSEPVSKKNDFFEWTIAQMKIDL